MAPDPPCTINVIALDAKPEVIMSAIVFRDERRKQALIKLGFHPTASPGDQRKAAQASHAAVIQYLGDGWSARAVHDRR